MIEFNYANYPHRLSKLTSFDKRGFTVGSWGEIYDEMHAKTEILNFELDANQQVKGYWTEIGIDYPSVQYISSYAALAIESTIYLFGGYDSDDGDSNRVVSFENNKYTDIGRFNQTRRSHGVIQINNLVYIVGGDG